MKAKGGKLTTQKAGKDGPRIVHLDSIPIADCWHEKKMWEAGEFARKLNADYSSFVIAQNENANRRRICEVYRRCFESTESARSGLVVVRDFAAHFPDLLFDAQWIKEMVRRESIEYSFSKVPKAAFCAIQTGLRSAVNSQSREPATQKYYKISAARLAAKETIAPELSKWNRGLQRISAPLPVWIAEQATEKADELMRSYRLQGQNTRKRLVIFLTQGHCSKAAVLIAARCFKVRERDVESSSD